ncbi:MAG: TolB-like protein [Hydrogenophaga sp.]|jgi:TolB-like protein
MRGMQRLSFTDVEIQPDERRVLVGGKPAILGARAFDLLMCLVEHRDRVVAKDELLQRVWPGMVVEETNLTVHVATLRKWLGPEAIATVSGRGYRFIAQLTVADSVPTSVAINVVEPAATATLPDLVPPPDKPSLAVMPFANLSGDAAQDYFVDGVVDDITTALSRVRAFFVIARSSSFTYKGRVVNAPQVGQELGVRYLVEGSFRHVGPRLRIGVQLVETAAGRLVWSQRFEGLLEDIFELQDQIAEQVVAAVEPNLMLAEVERARCKPTANLQAYDFCLRALPLVQASSSKHGIQQAIALLEQAIAMDNGFSYAKALYCWVHAVAYASRWFNHEQASRALPYAEEVLLDHRDDPTSLAYIGHTLAYVGRQHDKGLEALDRALALNPNSFAALHSSGWIRAYVGDADIAIEQLQRALRANPLVPQHGHGLSALGYAYLVAGRLDEALVTLQKAYVESPTFGITQISMVYCYARLERWQEAQDAAARLRAHDPSIRVSTFCALTPLADPVFVQAYVATLEAAGIPA